MQCQSYFPSYNSHYDLNMDNNGGGVKPIYNGNGIFGNGHYSNFVSSLPVSQFIRQTILMQEVTFRDQVQELHRVYRRQKELMGEFGNKEFFTNHLHLGTQCSVSFSAKFSQNTNVREPKGKKVGGRFLDLELPGEEYIDIEEGEFSEDGKPSNAPNSIDFSSNSSPKVVVESNPMASSANEWWHPILKRDSQNPSSFAQTKTNLADLNEPLIASDLEDGILEGRDPLVEVSCFNNNLVDSNVSNRLDLNSAFVESLESTPNDTPSSKALKEINLDTNEVMHLSCEDDLSPRGSKTSRLIDINVPYDTTNEEIQPVIEEDVLGYVNKNNPCQMNLNLSMNDDGLPQKSSISDQTPLKIDLEAPPSPEVEERPPPRGDSEDTQPEDGGDDPLEELVKIAANAIVSISSSSSSSSSAKSQPSPEKSENFDTMTLEWFAELVANSVSIDFETHKLDEFEAMTLNLTEMKDEEHLCFLSTPQIENFSSNSTPLSGQMRKERTTTTKTRRPKRKDFQREVLPSLASLSRYEVTEDIQMIEGLMQAAGTPWHLSRAARRTSRMGRKPRDKPMLSESNSGVRLVGWGKANRRPRGQRSPASPTTVLSKWLDCLI